MATSEEVVNKAVVDTGLDIDDRSRRILILIVENCLRMGYNSAVKDVEEGIGVKAKELTDLKRLNTNNSKEAKKQWKKYLIG